MADFTLYYAPRTRAGRVRWLLEELGVDYELVDVSKGSAWKQPAYRAIHPLAKVPALRDGDQILIESQAICLHLADRFPEAGLAPPLGTPARARYYQWSAFLYGTLEGIAFDPSKADELSGVLDVLAAGLGTPWALGEQFSALDCQLGGALVWAVGTGKVTQPELVAYTKRLQARPAYQRANA